MLGDATAAQTGNGRLVLEVADESLARVVDAVTPGEDFDAARKALVAIAIGGGELELGGADEGVGGEEKCGGG